MKQLFKFNILERYILREFLQMLLLCLFGVSALFIIFDFFERIRVFVREDAEIVKIFSYLLFKIPLTIHFMAPVAILVATLISIGRLSQNTEVTAMRACGVSLFWLSRPLLLAGLIIALLMFLAGETIVPWSSQRVEEIYQFDIKKSLERGEYNRSNFWFRSDNTFYNVGFYDSRTFTMNEFAAFEFNESFELVKRKDAEQVVWMGPAIGWSMRQATETTFFPDRTVHSTKFPNLPLLIDEKPADLLNYERRPETMSYVDLKAYIEKLRGEGVPVSNYLVQLASKISFPLVSVIAILIAFPFSLTSARSGTMTTSFVAGVATGFAYYCVHAFSTSLGSAELIPVLPAAWSANILIGSLGGYMMAGAEHP